MNPTGAKLVTLLAEEYQKAKLAGRKPFVELSAVWCQPCQRLHAAMDDPAMIAAHSGTYIIHLDVDRWSQELLGAGFNHNGIPAIFEINSEGYSNGRSIDGAAWDTDDPASIAVALAAFFAGE